MKNKLIIMLCAVFSLISQATEVSYEKIFAGGQQTLNGKGVNFSYLGSFEDELFEHLDSISEGANILITAAAYGRLPLKIIQEFKGDINIFVNELSDENLLAFREQLEFLKENSPDEHIRRNAEATVILSGDCLAIQEALVEEKFDIITGNNLLHFFDGEQILNYLINSYNLLKPGGKLYLFFYSFLKDLSLQEIEKSGQFSLVFLKIAYNISSLAKQSHGEILFPYLLDDNWLLGRANTIDLLLSKKPNGLGQTNLVPWQSIDKIASDIGFSGSEPKYFHPSRQAISGQISFGDELEENHSTALILTKPSNVADKIISMTDIDQNIVEACLNSLQIMKEVIENEVSFIEPYPWVKSKFPCGYKSCILKGTKACSRCKSIKYCSVECQKQDWKSHKTICSKNN